MRRPDTNSSPSQVHPGIEIREVSKAYGATTVVKDVSLSIVDGEFFSLLGASGCGKTTLLRMIAGFDRADRGTIRVAGEDVTHLAPNRRRVNMMFQHYALFPHLSVAKNIGFGPRIAKLPKAEINERVERALTTMRLDGMGHRRPAQLSGGQQQRVALARALIGNPSALLLDEPLGALDVKLRREMQAELKRVQREVGTTFVYVTHDQDEALAMSDRVAVMNGGRIEQVGSPDAIYSDPESLFVADFVGKLNILKGSVLDSNAGATRIGHGPGRTSVATCRSAPEGTPVTIGVRPHSVRLTAAGPEPARRDPVLRGRVIDVTYLGFYREIEVDTGFERVLGLLPAAHDHIQVGQDVDVSWSAESALVFDVASGARIR